MTPATRTHEEPSRRERLRQLAAVGEQVATVAHQSRGHLNILRFAAEMLGQEQGLGPKGQKAVGLIERSTKGLQRLLEDVRACVAPIRLDVHTESLAGIWRRAWAEIIAVRAPSAALVEQLRGPEPVHPVDGFRLSQVFSNLFENALAARPEGLEVVVRCREVEWRGRLAWRVCVSDNGPGLSQEQCREVFRPFSTTRPGGTGLGLTVARRFVEAHGGRIRAVAGRETGAEFRMLLPRTSHAGAVTGGADVRPG